MPTDRESTSPEQSKEQNIAARIRAHRRIAFASISIASQPRLPARYGRYPDGIFEFT